MATKNLIDTVAKCKDLTVRKGKEPYWFKTVPGRFIRYRRNLDGSVSRIAHLDSKRVVIHPNDPDDCDEALDKASGWQNQFGNLDAGVSHRYSVGDAVRDHLAVKKHELGNSKAY